MPRNGCNRYCTDRQSPSRRCRHDRRSKSKSKPKPNSKSKSRSKSRSRSRSKSRSRSPSRDRHWRSPSRRAYSSTGRGQSDNCNNCGVDYEICRNACVRRMFKGMLDTLESLKTSINKEADKRERKNILRSGPIPATDSKGLTRPADVLKCDRPCECHVVAQPTQAPQQAAPAPAQVQAPAPVQASAPAPAPAPAPPIWAGASAAVGAQMDNGVGMGALDLIDDFNAGLGGDFEDLMAGGLFNDLAAQYNLPTSQPVPAPVSAPVPTTAPVHTQAQTQPQYPDIMGTAPPRPENRDLPTSTANMPETPPVSPDISPAAPGLAWTGDAWHGPVWTVTLPTTPARPGTRRRPVTRSMSRARQSSSVSSHTPGSTDEASIKEEGTETGTSNGQDRNGGRTPGKVIDLDKNWTDDLFSDGEPGFEFTPGLRTPGEVE